MSNAANHRTYLDHNATSPLRGKAKEALLKTLDKVNANPSSVHHEGRLARQILDEAREQVADLLNAHPSRIFFTSGGTEACNTAIRGLSLLAGIGRPIMLSATEHPAVQEIARKLSRFGFPTLMLPVNANGVVDLDEFHRLVNNNPKPTCAAVMLANHETGVLQPVETLAQMAAEAEVPFFCDTVQAIGTVPLDVTATGVNLLAVAAHKFGGPQGIGCLYVEPGLPLAPLMVGGMQEGGIRAGTQAVALAASFGAAAQELKKERSRVAKRLASLRETMEDQIAAMDHVQIVSQGADRVVTTTCLTIENVEGATVMAGLDLEGIAVSTGAACSLGSLDVSPVLQAMGYSHAQARSQIRISIGYSTTESDIRKFLKVFPKVVEQCRSLSPEPAPFHLGAGACAVPRPAP